MGRYRSHKVSNFIMLCNNSIIYIYIYIMSYAQSICTVEFINAIHVLHLPHHNHSIYSAIILFCIV